MLQLLYGFPRWHSVKEYSCQCRSHSRCGFNPWVRKIPWRGNWLPTPVLLPGKSLGQRTLVGHSTWGHTEPDRTEHTYTVTASAQSSHSVTSNSLPAARQAFLSITNSRSLPKPMSIESVMPSNHLILCRPLLLLPSTFPSIRVFSNELVLHIRWPKYWSFSFNISPSNEYSGLISFRIDWFDLAVQGTLKSLFQHQNSKASVFGAQFSLWSNSHIHTWLLEKP